MKTVLNSVHTLAPLVCASDNDNQPQGRGHFELSPRYAAKVRTHGGGKEDFDPVARRICSTMEQIGSTGHLAGVNPSATTTTRRSPPMTH
jgi:hypothetical protein